MTGKFLLMVALFCVMMLQSCHNASVLEDSNTEEGDQMNNQRSESHSYVGMWVTEDGFVRQELLPNGRYDEARGDRESAYQGKYTIDGNEIEYVDDTGFTADGYFRNDVLYHAGMVFYREE